MCGAGGIYAEIVRDTAFAPAPITEREADAMIGRMRAARLLAGTADRRGFARLLVALGRLATDTRGLIAEIDVNPVIVTASGAAAVDALIVQKDKP